MNTFEERKVRIMELIDIDAKATMATFELIKRSYIMYNKPFDLENAKKDYENYNFAISYMRNKKLELLGL